MTVNINYDLMDYLPDSAPSTIALDVMEKEYAKDPANARYGTGCYHSRSVGL